VKFRRLHIPFLAVLTVLILQSCGSFRWDNFNKRKHLNLKSKEVYSETETIEESEEYAYVKEYEEESFAEEVEMPETESMALENSAQEEKIEPVYNEPLVIHYAEEVDRTADTPSKEEKIKEAKIKQLRKDILKANKWSWIVFVPFLVFMALIAILFFTLNLANPVAELLWILTIFGGLTLILGFVSSARAIHYSGKLKELSKDENDRAFAKKMINKSVAMIILYLLLPGLLAGGLYLFAE